MFNVPSQELSLSGMIASLKSINNWFSFLQLIKKHFYSQKHVYHAQLEALSLVKNDNENVRHYAVKNETLVKQGWYNEYPSINETMKFSVASPKKSKKFSPISAKSHIFLVHLILLFCAALKSLSRMFFGGGYLYQDDTELR